MRGAIVSMEWCAWIRYVLWLSIPDTKVVSGTAVLYCYSFSPPKMFFFYMFVHYMLTIVANIFENKNNTKKDMWFISEI